MITKKLLDEKIQNLVGLGYMVRAYEEIAAGRIKQSRDSVLKNRTYMSEINEIFAEVIASYKKQVDALMKAKKTKNKQDISFINKNGKTLHLFVSANTGLYGSIVKRTFELFVENSKGKEVDKAIVGRLGQSMWQESGIKEQYYFFDFPDQKVDTDVLKKILAFLISYEKVIIFYGKFQT